GKIEIKPDAADFGRYVLKDLVRRFDHVCCETTNDRWHSSAQALTITGLFKSKSGRRVKDDRFDINDRRHWVLGWDNHDKLNLLKTRQTELKTLGEKVVKEHTSAR